MATLPYTKTHIEDKTTGIMQNAGTSSVNIATIINSETGPLERVELANFNDLIDYYCTGNNISANDDNTIQCVGALLNSTSVDVVRVGSANIRVGRTNDDKIVYTDSNYNVIDVLTKLKFTEIPADVAFIATKIIKQANPSKYDIYWVGTGLEEDDPNATYHHIGNEVSVSALINGIASLDSNVIEFSDNTFFYAYDNVKSTDTVSDKTDGYDVTQVLSAESSTPINEPGHYITIDGTTYIYAGNGTATIDTAQFIDPVEINSVDNSCSASWFLAQIIANLKSDTLVSSKVRYVANSVTATSDNLKNRLYTEDSTKYLCYSSTDKFTSLWFVSGDVLYLFNCTAESTGLIQGTDYSSVISYNGDETNLIAILAKLDIANTSVILSVATVSAYFLDNASILIKELDDYFTLVTSYANGMYKNTLSEIKVAQNLNAMIDGVVYYCGAIPNTYNDVTSYVQLSKEPLSYDDFIEKLFYQLNSDLTIGFINTSTILVSGDINASSSTITINSAKINQSTIIGDSKFALVAKFPCTKALFDYSFVKNTSIEDYDVLDVTYQYKNLSNTISISFDANAVDGYGTLLYYSKYNEDFNFKNPYIQIVEINKDIPTPSAAEKVDVTAWGNEIIMMAPSPTDYADAISKFIDYTDKDYSFVWDSGYANTTLAKAMKTVALERHAQAVPSFPSTFKKASEFVTYATALDANSYEVSLVAPSFKNTFVGTFLTTVPAGLAYIVARVNSFKDVTSEMQPLFGATRGAVSAPNLTWNISKKDQQILADNQINSIITNINGTYLNFNLTSQKINSYLSEEQNVYMSNTLAHICDAYNPTIIAELNDEVLWDKVKRELDTLISNRLVASHTPTLHAYRIICDESLNTQQVREARQLIYKVQVQYTPSVAYVDAYVSVVRLNSF